MKNNLLKSFLSPHSPFIIGLALFSMFFGSGNLIFPLFVGMEAQSGWGIANLGLFLTGVLGPFLGFAAMLYYKGDYSKFFYRQNKLLGFIFVLALMLVWIPFGAGPRCIVVAYAGIDAIWPDTLSKVLFAILYSLATWWVVKSRSRMISILGSILTPLLVLFLGIIIVKGILYDATLEPTALATGSLVKLGLVEGYNTMDLIAAFFFSSSIISLVSESGKDMKSTVRLALKSSLIGVGLLGVVYLGMVYVAAANRDVLLGISKVNLMPHMAVTFLGSSWGSMAAAVMILACFTTSVAGVTVFADFLHSVILKEKFKRHLSIVMTVIVVFFMSLSGLEGITKITSPVLQVLYPILIVLIVGNTGYDFLRKTKR